MTTTTKKTRCPKCRSTALTVEGCRSLRGSQAVRCLQCGWHLFDPRDGGGMSRPLTPADFAPQAPGRHRVMRWEPCRVHGCQNRIDAGQNRTGLCQRHANQLRSWRASKRTTPAPLLQLEDGSYIDNPARAPRRA